MLERSARKITRRGRVPAPKAGGSLAPAVLGFPRDLVLGMQAEAGKPFAFPLFSEHLLTRIVLQENDF